MNLDTMHLDMAGFDLHHDQMIAYIRDEPFNDKGSKNSITNGRYHKSQTTFRYDEGGREELAKRSIKATDN